MPITIFIPALYRSAGDNFSFSNSDTLSRLSSDSQGNLTFNGKTVGEKSTEVAYNVCLSALNISQCSIPLPNDCDTSRSITLALQGIFAQKDIDWDICENDFPQLDFISWKGRGLEFIAREGDAVFITYYKKI